MKTLLKLASGRTIITIAGVALLILMNIAFAQAQQQVIELQAQFCVAAAAEPGRSQDIAMARTRCDTMTRIPGDSSSVPGDVRPCTPTDEGTGKNQVASCQPEDECPPPSNLWLCFSAPQPTSL